MMGWWTRLQGREDRHEHEWTVVGVVQSEPVSEAGGSELLAMMGEVSLIQEVAAKRRPGQPPPSPPPPKPGRGTQSYADFAPPPPRETRQTESVPRPVPLSTSEVPSPRQPDHSGALDYLGTGPHQWRGDTPLPYIEGGCYFKPVRQVAEHYLQCSCGARMTRPVYSYHEERSAWAWKLGGRMPGDDD